MSETGTVKQVGIISNSIYVVFIGTALATVIGIFIGEMIDEDLYTMVSITGIEDIGSFMAILLSWIAAAAVAGLRSKSGTRGALSAFIGTAIGATIIGGVLSGLLIISLAGVTVDQSKMATITPFLIGIVILLVVSVITGFATGSVVKEAPVQKATGRSRKTWESKKHESKWKCSRCKEPLKAGQMVCPKCGTPVIE